MKAVADRYGTFLVLAVLNDNSKATNDGDGEESCSFRGVDYEDDGRINVDKNCGGGTYFEVGVDPIDQTREAEFDAMLPTRTSCW